MKKNRSLKMSLITLLVFSLCGCAAVSDKGSEQIDDRSGHSQGALRETDSKQLPLDESESDIDFNSDSDADSVTRPSYSTEIVYDESDPESVAGQDDFDIDEETVNNLSIRTTTPFHDNRAWVLTGVPEESRGYQDYLKDEWHFIDKEGNSYAHFSPSEAYATFNCNHSYYQKSDINDKGTYITDFYEGYTYLETPENLYLINGNGDLVHTFENSTFDDHGDPLKILVNYGGGYAAYVCYEKGFDVNKVYLRIYNSEGTETADIEIESWNGYSNLAYLGSGRWNFNGSRIITPDSVIEAEFTGSTTSGSNVMYTSSQGYTYLGERKHEEELKTTTDLEFTDGISVFRVPTNMDYYIGYAALLLMITEQGDFVFTSQSVPMFKVNPATREVVELNHSYAEYINELISVNLNETDDPCYIGYTTPQKIIPLFLRGSDEKDYIALADQNLNVLDHEPIRYDYVTCSENRLIVGHLYEDKTADFEVFDENFQSVFTSKEKGLSILDSYKNGLARGGIDVAGDGDVSEYYMYNYIPQNSDGAKDVDTDNWHYIDLNGNVVLEEVKLKDSKNYTSYLN